MFSLVLISIFLVRAFVRGVPNPGVVTGDVTVHDPTMCRDGNGKYWVFSTGVGIEIRSSTDRIHFTYEGEVFPNGASWTDNYASGGSLWAPDCTYINGEFFLYYAASTFGSQNSAIFLAKSSTGNPGDWSNAGLVFSSKQGDAYNAIDPNLFIDTNGKWYLSFGSFWTGIKMINLNPSTGIWTGAAVINAAARSASSGTTAIEGSSMYMANGEYYLFSSWDLCCVGSDDTYNIRVGRSSSVTGSYVDQTGATLTSGGGTLVLGTHGHVIGPGGEDFMTDVDGPIMVYHYYNSTTNDDCTSDGGACAAFVQLGINKVDFSSGWPVVV